MSQGSSSVASWQVTRLFALIDVCMVLLALRAGLDPLSAFAIGLGLTASFVARSNVPYVFFAVQHCALYLSLLFLYKLLFGTLPGGAYGELPYLGTAAALIFLGLGALAVGLRISARRIGDIKIDPSSANLQMIWTIVLVLFAADWVVRIENNLASGGLAQVVNEVLKFRYFFFVLLLIGALAARRGAYLVASAGLFIMLPQSTSEMSGWSGIPFLVAYTLVSFLFLIPAVGVSRQAVRRALVIFILASAATAACGVLWTSGLKPAWRAAVLEGRVGTTTIDRIATFSTYVGNAVQDFNLQRALYELSGRTTSGLIYTAITIDNVPARVPHQYGAQTLDAVSHILTPRILFPDKAPLASDSELVMRYTNLYVAGAESATSIGLGYITEFYIDYGFFGAILACLGLGLYAGLLIRIWHLIFPSATLVHCAAIVLAWSSLNVYDAGLVKLVGSITLQGIVFGALLGLLRYTSLGVTLRLRSRTWLDQRALPAE